MAATHAGTLVPRKGLLSRAFGVLTAPRNTYAAIASHPRVLGALVLILGIVVAASLIFFSTQVGKDALFDRQLQSVESFGFQVTDEMYTNLERQAEYAAYLTAGSQLVFLPVMMLVIAGLALVVFNAILGGDAAFKQVFAVVVHSGFVLVLAQFFVLPLDYVRESLSSPTTLAVFLPFLDEEAFLAHLLGAIDLFYVWWIVNLAIGLGVLYKRRTGPIAVTCLAIYLAVALAIAAVRSAFAGA
jgi:hypothetical protein